MLDTETKRRIDNARDILVGKIPDPKSQVEQITLALTYKFMDDMDKQAEEWGGEASFFTGKFSKYSWSSIFDPKLGGYELLNLYSEALLKMNQNPNIPVLFREIFKNAYLPYRDPETLKSFLKEINGFCYDHSERLGDAYEYLLSVLGSQGDAGQFRTPRHIIDFIVKVLDPKKNETILDPACGTAGFLISSFKHIMEENTKDTYGDQLTPEERNKLITNFTGYDISPDMVRISLVNMYLHGFADPEIHEYDTLTSEERWTDTADVILANPPFMTPKGGIRPHKRFSIQANRSEVLFVDYIAEHLNNNGRAGVIVPEGIIFQSGNAYRALRKMLVENYLYAVVSLPAGVFNPYSGVKTSILFMDKALAKKSDAILFIKVENDGFDLGAQRRAIEKNDLIETLGIILSYKESLLKGIAPVIKSSSLAAIVKKNKIGEGGNYYLAGERYRNIVVSRNQSIKWAKIGSLCNLINGKAFKPSDWSTKEEGGLPIIRIQNLNNSNALFNYYSGYIEDKYIIQNGDLLFSWSGSKGTSFGAHIWNGDKAVLNQHIFKVEFSDRVIKEYFYYMLNKAVKAVEENLHGGVGLVHITKGNLENIEVPLPSLDDQREIVVEIEGYQKIIDGARQIVDNYKPQIKIDPDWNSFELGSIATNLDNKRKPITKCDRKPGIYPYYGASGIVDYVDDYIFEDYYLLISEDGANLLSRATPIAFTAEGQFWVNNHAHILKFENITFHKYVEYYLNSINLEFYITGSAQPKLNQESLNSIPIPIPPEDILSSLVNQLETEKRLVNANQELMEIFHQKIKKIIEKIWEC